MLAEFKGNKSFRNCKFYLSLSHKKAQCSAIQRYKTMANMVNLIVMGGAQAPYNANGPKGNPYNTTLGGVVNGISETDGFLVQNIISIADYIQPTSGPTYPAVNSVVRYKGVNPTNGYLRNIKMYVNQTRAAIVTAANA